MNAHKAAVHVSLATASAIVIGVLVCIAPIEASAQTYTFPDDSQRWQYMGPYDAGGLTPLGDFITFENPWYAFDGDGGAIAVGQEGFTPVSPTDDVIHGDLNSPKLAYTPGRLFAVRFDVTGSHMESTAGVWIQAVLLVKRPNDISDRRVASGFYEVPLGSDGAWETHTFAPQFPAGTIIKQINLRVFFAESSYYKGWIMVDNVSIR